MKLVLFSLIVLMSTQVMASNICDSQIDSLVKSAKVLALSEQELARYENEFDRKHDEYVRNSLLLNPLTLLRSREDSVKVNKEIVDSYIRLVRLYCAQ